MQVNSVARTLGNTAFIAFREVSEAARNDPALAMRTFANTMEGTLLKGVEPAIKEGYTKSVVPVVRGGLLALNAHRCVQTFKSPDASGMEKFMDATRVATDIVGVVGGVMVMATNHAALGANLMGFAYSADLVSHAFRGILHADDRVKFWQNALAEEGEKPNPDPDPNPDPNPTEPPAQPPTQPPKDVKKVDGPKLLDGSNPLDGANPPKLLRFESPGGWLTAGPLNL